MKELYADDVNGKPIEDLVPDYSILEHIAYEYPVSDAYLHLCIKGMRAQMCFLRRASPGGHAA